MKMNHNVAAAVLTMLASGLYSMPRGITDGNRLHSERAPPNSPEARERIAAANAKRMRRRAAQKPR